MSEEIDSPRLEDVGDTVSEDLWVVQQGLATETHAEGGELILGTRDEGDVSTMKKAKVESGGIRGEMYRGNPVLKSPRRERPYKNTDKVPLRVDDKKVKTIGSVYAANSSLGQTKTRRQKQGSKSRRLGREGASSDAKSRNRYR